MITALELKEIYDAAFALKVEETLKQISVDMTFAAQDAKVYIDFLIPNNNLLLCVVAARLKALGYHVLPQGNILYIAWRCAE